jgi:hypothetical protein
MAITASTWVPIDRIGLDQEITSTSTTQTYKTGMRIRCRDIGSTNRGEGEFIYAKGVASVAVGDYCVISPGGDAAIRAVARSIGPGGVAMAAIVASNWGWFQVKGRAIINVAASFADDLACYTTATAGTLDDAVVTGDLVYGARSAGAIDTGQALVDINNPFTGDTDNSA